MENAGSSAHSLCAASRNRGAVPVPQGLAHLGQSDRHVGLEILAHPAQPLRFAAAGDQQSDGVEQMPAPPVSRRPAWETPGDPPGARTSRSMAANNSRGRTGLVR